MSLPVSQLLGPLVQSRTFFEITFPQRSDIEIRRFIVEFEIQRALHITGVDVARNPTPWRLFPR